MRQSSNVFFKRSLFRSNSRLSALLYAVLIYFILLVSMSSASFADEETKKTLTTNNAKEILSFKNDQQRDIYQQLIIELRCPKCQNQNIADSNADIAQDMRKKVYEMALQNKDKAEIKQFMLDRFGEFVLYKPQFSGKNLLLWLGPILLLLFVIFLVIRIILRNAVHLAEEEKAD